MKASNLLPILVCLSLFFVHASSYAQHGTEPELREIDSFQTPLDFGLRKGAGFNIVLNNFGFGIGGEYRRVLAPKSELVIEMQFTSLRDVTEQNYQFFGQQIIPNKRNRIMSFPLTVGFKQRLFAEPVSDNFRFFTSAKVGPTAVFVYPYYNTREIYYIMEEDLDFNNPIIDPSIIQYGPIEAYTGQLINDVFQGWNDGEWKLGTAGQLAIGVDFGSDFRKVTSVLVGFTFQYFREGIQVMDPYSELFYFQGTETSPPVSVIGKGSPKQKFFGSPFITLTFGSMW